MSEEWVRIIACTPTNPNWRWYENRIGEKFLVTMRDGVFLQVWDGKIDRLVKKIDIEICLPDQDNEALRRQVEELQADNAAMVEWTEKLEKSISFCPSYHECLKEILDKAESFKHHPGATLLKERDELRARCEELESLLESFTKIYAGEQFIDGDYLNIKLGGAGAMLFMKLLVDLFKVNGGENFLTVGLEGDGHKYAITIQNADGQDTPAEKMERMEARAELNEKALELACNSLRSDDETFGLLVTVASNYEQYFLAQAKKVIQHEPVQEAE